VRGDDVVGVGLGVTVVVGVGDSVGHGGVTTGGSSASATIIGWSVDLRTFGPRLAW